MWGVIWFIFNNIHQLRLIRFGVWNVCCSSEASTKIIFIFVDSLLSVKSLCVCVWGGGVDSSVEPK